MWFHYEVTLLCRALWSLEFSEEQSWLLNALRISLFQAVVAWVLLILRNSFQRPVLLRAMKQKIIHKNGWDEVINNLRFGQLSTSHTDENVTNDARGVHRPVPQSVDEWAFKRSILWLHYVDVLDRSFTYLKRSPFRWCSIITMLPVAIPAFLQSWLGSGSIVNIL